MVCPQFCILITQNSRVQHCTVASLGAFSLECFMNPWKVGIPMCIYIFNDSVKLHHGCFIDKTVKLFAHSNDLCIKLVYAYNSSYVCIVRQWLHGDINTERLTTKKWGINCWRVTESAPVMLLTSQDQHIQLLQHSADASTLFKV